jgi:hypothetical protein
MNNPLQRSAEFFGRDLATMMLMGKDLKENYIPTGAVPVVVGDGTVFHGTLYLQLDHITLDKVKEALGLTERGLARRADDILPPPQHATAMAKESVEAVNESMAIRLALMPQIGAEVRALQREFKDVAIVALGYHTLRREFVTLVCPIA